MGPDREHPAELSKRPRRRSRRWFLGAAVAGAVAGAGGLWFRGCGGGVRHDYDSGDPPEMDLTDLAPRPDGKTDLTFFVAADTHFGHEGIEKLNRRQIETMNALPGTPLPPVLGGKVGRPRGVLIAGDLTNYGREYQWDQFVAQYGLTGSDGLLKYPVRECTGNHDRYMPLGTAVMDGVRKRHGSLVRGWLWQGVCFVCLDCYPTERICNWLKRQLARIGPTRPVVIYFHYSIVGPYSSSWSADEKAAFARVIRGHNILGIFHGHYHGSEHYTWEGFDVYNVGSPRHGCHTFAAVHITDSRMTVASRWWDTAPRGTGGRWYWTHSKAVATA